MKSSEALEVLCEEFQNATAIREMPGNPNFLGWHLFSVDGELCYVTTEKEVLTKPNEIKTHEK